MIETNGYQPLAETSEAPCPFCASTRSCFIESLPDDSFLDYYCWIECCYCGAQGSTATNKEMAIVRWINRNSKQGLEATDGVGIEPEFIIEDTPEDKLLHRLLQTAAMEYKRNFRE